MAMQPQKANVTLEGNDGRFVAAEVLGQFGIMVDGQQVDFALCGLDGKEEMVQIRDGKYTAIRSYPENMTARQAYEATLQSNRDKAEVFV